jgi:phosphonate ABC transporter permease subunit PhnE
MNSQTGSPPSPARAAFRRLILILSVVAGIVIYAYGWEVTDISLAPTQEETRQVAVTRAMQELLSPNIFSQPIRSETFRANFIMNCEAGAGTPVEAEGAFIQLSPACGVGRDTITIEGTGFAPGTDTELSWIPAEGQPRPLGAVLTDSTGSFRAEITVPNIRGAQAGAEAIVAARAIIPVGTPQLSSTTNLVIEKMIETIFLALMATTLALPIAVVLSFLAAHNLMKPIRMPIGKALIGLALFPVGWMIGQLLVGTVAETVVDIGKGDFAALGTAALFFFASVGATRAGSRFGGSNDEPSSFVRSSLTSLGIALLVILALALVGGLGVTLGNLLAGTGVALLGYLGNFINTLGNLIELTITAISGLVVGVYVAGLGMRLSSQLIRQLSPAQSRIAGAVLGAIGGALIMMGAAAIGTQAALLTLLVPLIAGLLGAQIPVMLYDRTVGHVNPLERTTQDRTLRPLLRFLGFAITFAVVFILFDISRSIVQGRLPVASTFLTQSAVVGAIFGSITAGMTGIRASMPLGTLVYNITRTTLNALRAIEPLIMGIVFVIWVGIGPFAGVLALTLHSIASLGKLYSEQIENIDEGPIEALLSTGANRVQTIIYAVVPQIIPPYIAFTLYRWDINVRMSTIIGFVGGGGIGFLLQQQINLLRYRDAGVAVLAIAIVVSVLDYASASIRERIM